MAPPPRRPRALPSPDTAATERQVPAHDPSDTATDEEPAHDPAATDELVSLRKPARVPLRRHRREAPGPRSRVLPALVVLGVLVGAAAWLRLGRGGEAPPGPEARARAEAGRLFQDGKKWVRSGDWVGAAKRFDEAQALAPGLDGVKPYLDAARLEVPLQERRAGRARGARAGEGGDRAGGGARHHPAAQPPHRAGREADLWGRRAAERRPRAGDRPGAHGRAEGARRRRAGGAAREP